MGTGLSIIPILALPQMLGYSVSCFYWYQVADDWKYVAMVLDRILLWVFTVACIAGTGGIILVAPSLYDTRIPVDIQQSKLGKFGKKVLPMPVTASLHYQ